MGLLHSTWAAKPTLRVSWDRTPPLSPTKNLFPSTPLIQSICLKYSNSSKNCIRASRTFSPSLGPYTTISPIFSCRTNISGPLCTCVRIGSFGSSAPSRSSWHSSCWFAYLNLLNHWHPLQSAESIWVSIMSFHILHVPKIDQHGKKEQKEHGIRQRGTVTRIH